jgi:hypothetical protein
MPFQLVPTEDGSLSCVDSETGQLSHNRAGAYTEAVHLYDRPSGLSDLVLRQGGIRVLDACYGMGYNTWSLINELVRLEETSDFKKLVANHSPDQQFTVSLVCIEKHPEVLEFLPQILSLPTFDPLNSKIGPSEHNAYYRTLTCSSHTKVGGVEVRYLTMHIAPHWRFEVELWVDDLRNRVPQLQGPFDAVFHDPFSPQKMPELWTVDLFREYHRLLQPRNGRLLTYCAAAAVRGGLMEAGFQVSSLKGLGAKTGSTLARAGCDDLDTRQNDQHPLEACELEYLATRAGIPYRDPGLSHSREGILSSRVQEQAASSRPSGAQALKKMRAGR